MVAGRDVANLAGIYRGQALRYRRFFAESLARFRNPFGMIGLRNLLIFSGLAVRFRDCTWTATPAVDDHRGLGFPQEEDR